MVKIFLVTLCITYAIGCQIDCTINDDALHSTLHHFTTEKPALLHTICYSMCINKVSLNTLNRIAKTQPVIQVWMPDIHFACLYVIH